VTSGEVEMPVRAIAFQESVAKEEIEEIFKEETNQLFGSTSTLECGHCHAKFAVFYPSKDAVENNKYTRSLEVRVAEDCKTGHSRFVKLTVTP
jgi:hypothetical protein